jgi:hypothetical protein
LKVVKRGTITVQSHPAVYGTPWWNSCSVSLTEDAAECDQCFGRVCSSVLILRLMDGMFPANDVSGWNPNSGIRFAFHEQSTSSPICYCSSFSLSSICFLFASILWLWLNRNFSHQDKHAAEGAPADDHTIWLGCISNFIVLASVR